MHDPDLKFEPKNPSLKSSVVPRQVTSGNLPKVDSADLEGGWVPPKANPANRNNAGFVPRNPFQAKRRISNSYLVGFGKRTFFLLL